MMEGENQDSKSSIRFVNFNVFKNLSEFPRCPDRNDLTCSLSDINRNDSLLIFVSHCWLRGADVHPHPDNVTNDKLKLCVEGIENVKRTMAPRMKDCYIWMDYCCMNQINRSSIPKELKRYDQIVEVCDIIFTPIVDKLVVNDIFFDPYVDINSPLWNGLGPLSYLNRAWCRVEMMYAANIPTLGQQQSKFHRYEMFEGALRIHCQGRRRPHILYNSAIIVLPPLQNFWFDKYNPLQGSLTVCSDINHVQKLIDDLIPYMEKSKVVFGYEGERNNEGEMHGKGVLTDELGTYEGEFLNGRMDGEGINFFVDGSIYKGHCKEDKREGQGTYYFANGSIYEGKWKNDLKEGLGVYRYANGDVYEGEYKNDKKEGMGSYRYAQGNVFVGEWKNDKKNGQGILTMRNGIFHQGLWKDDVLLD